METRREGEMARGREERGDGEREAARCPLVLCVCVCVCVYVCVCVCTYSHTRCPLEVWEDNKGWRPGPQILIS